MRTRSGTKLVLMLEIENVLLSVQDFSRAERIARRVSVDCDEKYALEWTLPHISSIKDNKERSHTAIESAMSALREKSITASTDTDLLYIAINVLKRLPKDLRQNLLNHIAMYISGLYAD